MNMSLSKLWEIVKDREAWRAAVHEVTKSQTWLRDWTELNSASLFPEFNLQLFYLYYRLFATPWTSSLPGSSLHGILQARVLEWVAISFSRGSSQPRDQTPVSRIPGRRFNLWATGEAPRRPVNIFMALFLDKCLSTRKLFFPRSVFSLICIILKVLNKLTFL